jgi:hypothetical protein
VEILTHSFAAMSLCDSQIALSTGRTPLFALAHRLRYGKQRELRLEGLIMKTKYGKVLTLIGAAIAVSCLTALNGVSARDRNAVAGSLEQVVIGVSLSGAGNLTGARHGLSAQ